MDLGERIKTGEVGKRGLRTAFTSVGAPVRKAHDGNELGAPPTELRDSANPRKGDR